MSQFHRYKISYLLPTNEHNPSAADCAGDQISLFVASIANVPTYTFAPLLFRGEMEIMFYK